MGGVAATVACVFSWQVSDLDVRKNMQPVSLLRLQLITFGQIVRAPFKLEGVRACDRRSTWQ